MFPELTRDDVFRLETARLWLRWPRARDAAAIVQLAGDKAVAEMTALVPHPYPAEAAHGFILAARRENAEGRSLTMAITERSRPDVLIGTVRIGGHGRDGSWATEEAGAELGYWLGAPHWGEGLATEAARAMIDAYFGYAGGRELGANARVVNQASRRVLEKCGFSAVGSGLKAMPARGGVFPVDHFRLERRAWSSFKAWSNSGFVPQARHEEARA